MWSLKRGSNTCLAKCKTLKTDQSVTRVTGIYSCTHDQIIVVILLPWCSVIGFDSSDEAAVIERLLEAYGETDEEEITKCTTDPVFKCMDNDVSKIM